MDSSVPEAFIFMKVGWHGGEPLEDILDRKKIELKKAGAIFWGYGGAVLHPTNQVRRFVEERKERIEVLMQVIESNSGVGPPAGTAKQFAASEKECMKPVPNGICTGGEHALVLDKIRKCEPELELDLRDYKVGVGDKKETPAIQYLSFRGMKKLTGKTGRTDKGCLVKARPRYDDLSEPVTIKIKYRAYLKDPYAVFLWPLKK